MSIRILYVDDDDMIREIAALALGMDREFEVRLCASGAEALAVASVWRPDLVLLDVMMPDMDGPATLAQLRQLPAMADVPVVFITARAQGGDREGYAALGAVGTIVKPFDAMQLAATVRGYLGS